MDTKAIVSAVLASTVLNTVVAYFLDTVLARRAQAKAATDLEVAKSSLLQELEKAKHALQLEQAKLGIIYEHQRVSFTKVIQGMDVAIATIEDTYDRESEEFSAIRGSDLDKFLRLSAAESLYTGSEGDEALDLFSDILSDTVGTLDNEFYISDSHLRWSLKQLRFISTCIREYFRCRIGLSSNNRLRDIAYIGTCRLLNKVRTGTDSPLLEKYSLFDWKKYSTVEELALTCSQHSLDLLAANRAFIQSLSKKEDGRSFLFNYVDEATRYQQRLVI